MKQRKEFDQTEPQPAQKPQSTKTVSELTNQINEIIGKDPKKAAKALEFWINDNPKNQKKAA